MLNHKDLMKVSKPVRYIGEEINSIVKEGDDFFNVCLAFPDVYEVGMSHLGMKILYERLNRSDAIFAERFFMPWADAIDTLNDQIFVSLETFRPLKSFDVLGFSLQYELSYTNVLATLKNSHISVYSKDRTDDDPIIIAGGPCVFNPAPMSSFIDAFFVGEMEEKLVDVMVELKELNHLNRNEKLLFLSSIDCIYVPEDPNASATRHIHMPFHSEKTLDKLLVPLMPIVQDRVTVEISRGCSRGCRFCQAGMIYRPVREKSEDLIIENALEQIESSGYSEISLLSLSASDHTQLESMLLKLSDLVKKRKISLSLPSLRADRIQDFIFKELSKIRKSGFTIAPEAGSQRLRTIINKNLSETDITNAVIAAAKNGWNGAKLYFMIGLPFETDEDVIEIAELAKRLKGAAAHISKRFNITVSVSNFVPKAFTPYQWFPQDSAESFHHKQQLIKDNLYRSRIKYKFHDVSQSLLEGAFSRGNKQMGEVLVKAVENGCLFDGWGEHFNGDKWNDAFDQLGYTVSEFSAKEYTLDADLPWDCIHTNIDKKFLVDEFQKSEQVAATEDCRLDDCTQCGICDFVSIKNIDAAPAKPREDVAQEDAEEAEKHYVNYVMVFSKKQKASLMSSIELCRTFHHAFSISKIDIEFSYGFNPQPRLSYVFPLSVGIEGENEIIYFSAANLGDTNHIKSVLNKFLPDGITINDIYENQQSKKVSAATVSYRFNEKTIELIQKLLDEDRAFYVKKNKKGVDKKVDLKDFLIEISGLSLVMSISTQGGFNLLDFFRYLDYNIYNLDAIRESVKISKG